MDTDWYWSIPPPLRPGKQDLAIYTAETASWRSTAGAPRVLVLGATPALHDLPWPAGTDLLAVDKSAFMLEQLWPGNAETTRCQDWAALSLPDRSRDIALTDLGLMFVAQPAPLADVATRLGRVIAPGGVFIARHVCEAGAPEDFDGVIQDLINGKVLNSSVLKMRLAIALGSRAGRVRLGDIWARFDQAVPDRVELLARTGWSARELANIEGYRNADEIYHLSESAELVSVFCTASAGFDLIAQHAPDHALRKHTRILTFRRR